MNDFIPPEILPRIAAALECTGPSIGLSVECLLDIPALGGLSRFQT